MQIYKIESSNQEQPGKTKEPEKVQIANAYDLMLDFSNDISLYPSLGAKIDVLCDFIDDQGIQAALEKYLEKRKAALEDDVG